MLRPSRAACLLAVLAIAVAGCGKKKVSTAAIPSAPAPTQTTPEAPTTKPGPTAIKQKLPASDKKLSKKPKVPTPTGTPPANLQMRDIVKGSGKTAKSGGKLTVQYVGVAYSTGEQFDASWDRHQPFPFKLGAGMVIPGWDQGLVGMKVGGRRELVIPPQLAYGPQGQPPKIGPNETLIFIIDLKKVG
jgi:peptidylprolyl isomerase